MNGVLREFIETSRAMRQLLMDSLPPDQAAPDGMDQINAFRTRRHLAHPWPGDSIETDNRHTFRPDGIQRFLRVYGGNVDPRFLQTTGRLLPDAGEPALIGANSRQAELKVRFSTNRIRVEMYLRRLPGQERRVDSAEFAAHAVWNPTMQGRILRWQDRLELPSDREEITHEVEIDGSGLPTLFTLNMADASGGRVFAGWSNPTLTHVSREAGRPLWLMPSQQYQSVELTEQDLARLLPDAWRPSEAWMRGGRIGEDGVVLSPGGKVWLKCSDEIIQIDVESWREDGHEETGAGATGWWFKGGRLQLYEFPSTEGSRPGTHLFRAWGRNTAVGWSSPCRCKPDLGRLWSALPTCPGGKMRPGPDSKHLA